VVTAGDVGAANFSKYGASCFWWGDLAELVIYDRALPDPDRLTVELYLASKYALHAPPRVAPAIAPGGGLFADPVTVSLSGLGVVRYTTDGSDPTEASSLYTGPFVVTPTATVKARGFAETGGDPSAVATATFLSSAAFAPSQVSGLALWVRADAGVESVTGQQPAVWTDQSGQGNHLVQPEAWRQPRLLAGPVLPALEFDGQQDYLKFTTRLTNIRTVFWVVRENPAATAGFHYLLGDPSSYDFSSGASRQIWSPSFTSAAPAGWKRPSSPATSPVRSRPGKRTMAPGTGTSWPASTTVPWMRPVSGGGSCTSTSRVTSRTTGSGGGTSRVSYA